ncbi:MAG: hypothetical protein AB7G20_08090 [Sulfurimonas sp.]|uniref:hypothetical protein n=1 Tax=Sulfurimonas sp. TaxID=2022749 RepID=UPI003D13DD09
MGCSIFKCCESKADTKIVLQEKQSKFILSNPDRKTVAKVSFDKCREHEYFGMRCDFVLYLKDLAKQAILFVELKGNDLLKAIKQLEASIRYFGLQSDLKIYAYAVTSRSPLSSTYIQNEKMRLKKIGITFDAKNKIMEKTYNEY